MCIVLKVKCITKNKMCLLQIKYTIDKQILILKRIMKKHQFFVSIYDVLNQRRNSKTQYKHEKQRRLQLILPGKKE